MATLEKLQPHRTIHLRGFDRRGAAASLHHASDTGFQVSGIFRDAADFAVLMLWDADNFFEHESLRYFPDSDFSGMTLQFDYHAQGLQTLDSRNFPSIDWPYLDLVLADGGTARVRLSDYAAPVGAGPVKASAAFTVVDSGFAGFDRVTLWFQNFAWDYIVPNPRGAVTAADVAADLTTQINGTSWGANLFTLSATSSGALITVTCNQPGADGNRISLYQINKNGNLLLTPDEARLTGGSSDVTWRVTLPFDSVLNYDSGLAAGSQFRQMWLTFAPPLTTGATFTDTEFLATVTNWNVTDTLGKRALQVAGPGSTHVGSSDAWAQYQGAGWTSVSGWFRGGYAQHTAITGDSVNVSYSCQYVHDLYLLTSLYTDRGTISVSVDGDTATTLDCYLKTEPAIQTRRLLRSGIAPGTHQVVITLDAARNALSTGQHFYFDALEAAVPMDAAPADRTYPGVMPATDYDTDHAYKLSPQRLVWMVKSMGFRGDLDHYLGVFWWNQRKRVGGTFPSVTVTYGGTWAGGEQAFLTVGGTTIGKSVFPADTPATIARHFAQFINELFVGVWAQAAGAVLTITNASPIDLYTFSFSESHVSASGTVAVTGSLLPVTGGEGVWVIDESALTAINRAVRDWHADLFAELVANGLTATAAFSMELVNPPDNAPAAVWAQRFPDGSKVETDTGFNSLKSTQCTFSPVVAAFQARAYGEIAGLMQTAGLTPSLQFGEFLWWFFSWYRDSIGAMITPGMALQDAYTQAQAAIALGRPLASFSTPDDDPSVNSYADANFLRSQIKAHIDAIRSSVLASYPSARFELLYPNDVTFRQVTPRNSLGGRLNHYINLPAEYVEKAGSGLDRLKMEALAFGATELQFDWAKETMQFPFTSPRGWARSDCAYLVPWFNGNCGWQREYLAARNEGLPLVCFWALDHLCLFSWPLPLPINNVTILML